MFTNLNSSLCFQINVTVPTEYLGEVISDLVKKRGKIQHIDESKFKIALKKG